MLHRYVTEIYLCDEDKYIRKYMLLLNDSLNIYSNPLIVIQIYETIVKMSRKVFDFRDE